MHDPANNNCPRNADPRNECCACGAGFPGHHAGRFNVGQRIRAYDFPGITSCYMEGTVLDPNGRMLSDPYCPAYVIAIEKQVFNDEDVTKPCDRGYIPHRVAFREDEGRIVAL